MEFSEKKAIILNALIERRGLQHIIDVAAEVLNNPIFLYDVSQKILAKSGTRQDDIDTWTKLFPDGHLKHDAFMEVENKGILKQLYDDDTPVFGAFEFYPHRFLGCRVRDKGSVIGIAAIVENNPIQEDDGELLVILCKSMLFEMLYLDRTAMQRTPYFGLFKDILESKITASELVERKLTMRLSFPQFMQLFLIEYSSAHSGFAVYFLRDTLNTSLNSAYSIIYDDVILLIANGMDAPEKTLGVIQNCAQDTLIQIGVSRRFDNIMHLPTAYEQARAAIRINQKLAVHPCICFYDDIMLYHFFETASAERDLLTFCNPIIGQLEEYDKAHSTYLKSTLETYLDAGRNIQRASKQLFLHKNTLYYRIRKIEELCTISLEDENICFSLQFSFRLLRVIC